MNGPTVRDAGEFGLIEALSAVLPPSVRAGPALRFGIGDDAAVWTPTPGESLIVTTDSLVDRIHFRLDWTDWASLGHKSLAVNLSDVAAMGGVPRLAVITLGLRGDERVGDLEDLYRGLGSLAARTRTLVAGGDVVASPDALTIHVTVLGETDDGRVLTRSGAKPGDVVAVSGTIGAAAAGFRLLRAGPDDPRRRAVTADLLLDAHLRPEPRLALGRVLLEHGATAAMDLSDGLLGDLPNILAMSGVGAVIDAESMPVAAAVRALFPDDWLDLATRGGEDYELLFTAPPESFEAIQAAADEIGSTVTAIGTIVERDEASPLRMRGLDGVARPVAAGAFDHFG
ncbi:MAG: thiamine-phosphate kinase [Thermomicrobiales bacterium]